MTYGIKKGTGCLNHDLLDVKINLIKIKGLISLQDCTMEISG
jgi:hypothetical protein